MTRFRFYLVVALAGAVVMALEIIASRVLAPHFGSSVYVWGSIISVFLAALALGYALGGRLADRAPSLPALGRLLLLAAVCQSLLMLAGERIAERIGLATHGSAMGTLLASALLFGPPSVLLATVSPYAIKLAARDLSHLGNTAGRLFALSTGGSLVGTLGCTFGLIPFLQLRPLLALLLGATAATAAVALGPPARAQRTSQLAAAALLIAAGWIGTRPVRLPEGALHTRITPYQTLEVGEIDDRRYLKSNGFLQSVVITRTGEPGLGYIRQVALATLFQPRMERALFIGMGGATAGTYLQRRLPHLRTDYVDIDPAIPEIARRWFGFVDGPLRRVHIADGRRFLAASEERWDLVLVDAYVGLSIPFHLTTSEFMREVEAHLAPGGVFAFNLAGGLEDPFSRAIFRTVRSHFGTARAFDVAGGGNVLVIAGPGAGEAYLPDLQARARELDRRWSFSPSLERMLAFQRPDLPDEPGALVLVDAYAPVEHLIDGNRLRDVEDSRWRELLLRSAPAPAAAEGPR
jgi:predicted membrane-bound spermidine synthase